MAAAAVLLDLLAGCAQVPLGPTVIASAGPGKTPDAFMADMAVCKQMAGQSVSGQVQTANSTAVAGAVAGAVSTQGAAQGSLATQGGIQAQYDATYGDCMAARGENVAGRAPLIVAAPPPPPETGPPPPVYTGPDPILVKAVQVELIRLTLLNGNADGIPGPKTGGAVRAFETANNMPPDGAITHHLLERLQATPTPTTWTAPPPPS